MKENLTRWMWLPNWKTEGDKQVIKAEFVREFVISKEEYDAIKSEAAKAESKEDKNSSNETKRESVCPGTIKISADSKYKLYVNNHFVCYGPARGDRQVWYYDEPNISPYLCEETNTIRIEVLYYQPYGSNVNFGIAHGMVPALLFDAQGCQIKDLQDDIYDETRVSEAGQLLKWKGRIVPAFNIEREAEGFAPLMIMENISKRQNAEYQIPVLYDAWQISNEVSPGNIYPRPIPFMYLKRKELLEKGRRITVKAHETKKIVLDAGEEETGFIYVKLSEMADMNILYSESYYLTDEEGNSYKANRTDRQKGHLEGFADTCTGAKEYSPFWYRTFRFIELTINALDKDVEIENVFYYETGYPLEVKNEYKGADAEKKKIWDICLRTLRRCMQETYIDCPFYEQLQYIMDTRSQILYTYKVAEDDRLAREAIRSFARSQRADGLLNAAYPSTASNVIPGFSIYFILMVNDNLQFTGDRIFAKQFLGNIDRILCFFEQNINELGLVAKVGGLNNPREKFWSFIDWTKEWDATNGVPDANLSGPITMESLLYILGLETAAVINAELGRMDTANEYRKRAQDVRVAIRKHCMNENLMVVDGPSSNTVSQHCQVFAALCDVIPLELAKKNLEETILHPDKYAQCSVAMMFYLFRSLEKTGLYEKYAEEKLKIYHWMIDMNLSTCVEDDVAQRSDCHGWGALPLYEFLKEV